jgi:hypothetical protein
VYEQYDCFQPLFRPATQRLDLLQESVADPHHFNADPDPTTHVLPDLDPQMLQNEPLRPPPVHFNADPDPAFDADPDP